MVCAPPASATARASLRRGAQVRNLYKRIIIAGRDYPAGLDYVRQKAKAEFAKRAHIQDDVEACATPLSAILRVQRNSPAHCGQPNPVTVRAALTRRCARRARSSSARCTTADGWSRR